jgi:hypothetical protein
MPVRDLPVDMDPETEQCFRFAPLSSQAVTLAVSALTNVKMRSGFNATQKPLLVALVGSACAGGR